MRNTRNQKIGSERKGKNNNKNNHIDFASNVRRFERRLCARKTISVNTMETKNNTNSQVFAISIFLGKVCPQEFGKTQRNQTIAKGSQRMLPMPVRIMSSRCIRMPNE